MTHVELLRQLGETASPSDTLTGTIITGVVTLVVASLGYLATRARMSRVKEPAPTQPFTEHDPQWVIDLRADKEEAESENRVKEKEIRRLQRLCVNNGINPFEGG